MKLKKLRKLRELKEERGSKKLRKLRGDRGQYLLLHKHTFTFNKPSSVYPKDLYFIA
ncbi:hypothetical protein [Prevotella sp. HUN102]|uniref:hypothetical protein n=1 Tax=Prevotella sp. HUN102 TaxID=1392486 RepID=UPI0012DCF8E7|nr:hypothetical protein [Prevotella sp. HUN102]